MRKCFIDSCDFNSKEKNCSVFRFPNRDSCLETFIKWTDFCQIERAHAKNIINSAHLWEQHFDPICFNINSIGAKYPKRGSIPTISNCNRVIIDKPINHIITKTKLIKI